MLIPPATFPPPMPMASHYPLPHDSKMQSAPPTQQDRPVSDIRAVLVEIA